MKTPDIVKQDPIRKILARIYGGGRGAVFTPKDFLDLAGSETVRQVLGRLTRVLVLLTPYTVMSKVIACKWALFAKQSAIRNYHIAI